jgi:hypothetical protein
MTATAMYRSKRRAPRGRVAVTVERAISAPREQVLPAVQHIQNIECTEVKADEVVVTPLDASRGSYRVRGHFAGVPWRGQFFYELNPDGFHSTNAARPGRAPSISGGFVVKSAGAGACRVTHYEDYQLPVVLRPMRPLIRIYLRWSMRRELQHLAHLVGEAAPPLSPPRRRDPRAAA